MMIVATKTVMKRDSKLEMRYIKNHKGEKTEVVLPIELYGRLLEKVEELEDIKDFEEKHIHE